MLGFSAYADQLALLGKHKTSVCCLYINKLADIDMTILSGFIRQSVIDMRKMYSC